MTFPQLLHALSTHGIKLELKLAYEAPKGSLTPEIRAALIEHKPQLLAKLGRDALWAALEPKGDLSEPADDAGDDSAILEREAIKLLDDGPTLRQFDLEPVDSAPFPAFESLPAREDLDRALTEGAAWNAAVLARPQSVS
jgi:hypothetical protein